VIAETAARCSATTGTARRGSRLGRGSGALGRYAGERALARLGARKLPTCKVPVLFEAPVACSLLGSFVAAASGGSLYRKASFLADALGKQVFSRKITIEERPRERQALASSPYDEEGVATTERAVVRDGVLEGYFLGCYSARKLGMRSTGSAGGNHNLVVRSERTDLRGMLKRLHKGLFVTEVLGHGVNLVTGDYSQGAAGYWVEGGEIAYPVEENHRGRKPARHVPVHRGRRKRRRGARLAQDRLDSRRKHDHRRRLNCRGNRQDWPEFCVPGIHRSSGSHATRPPTYSQGGSHRRDRDGAGDARDRLGADRSIRDRRHRGCAERPGLVGHRSGPDPRRSARAKSLGGRFHPVAPAPVSVRA
jgi:hypothetical protein